MPIVPLKFYGVATGGLTDPTAIGDAAGGLGLGASYLDPPPDGSKLATLAAGYPMPAGTARALRVQPLTNSSDRNVAVRLWRGGSTELTATVPAGSTDPITVTGDVAFAEHELLAVVVQATSAGGTGQLRLQVTVDFEPSGAAAPLLFGGTYAAAATDPTGNPRVLYQFATAGQVLSFSLAGHPMPACRLTGLIVKPSRSFIGSEPIPAAGVTATAIVNGVATALAVNWAGAGLPDIGVRSDTGDVAVSAGAMVGVHVEAALFGGLDHFSLSMDAWATVLVEDP